MISGATRRDRLDGVLPSGVWSASVPAGSASRQLYVNGTEAPVAQATPSQLHFAGGWKGSATGYDLSADPAALAFFSALTPAQLQQVEFDYPGGNGQWTDSKCRVQSLSGSSLTMDEPCWTDVTNRATYAQASGGLPSMSTSQCRPRSRTRAACCIRASGSSTKSSHTLYLDPLDGADPASLDVELPRLETLVQGAGSLAQPVHDLTFSGLTFSYATWNAPSAPAGFADVQSNLHMTGANNQGMCTFSSPAGTCPWGLLTEPHANVSFTAADHITLTGNTFTELGGAGLSIAYGSSNNLVQGNEFTDIASTAILLGCTADPTPVNPDPAHFPNYLTTNPDTAQTIKDNCTPDPSAVAADKIGTNEIDTGNTISDNVIPHVGTDYPSASGITLLFNRDTMVTHNDLYDLPYTGITAGVIQGHVDLADHPANSLNINADNTISYNLIHDYLQVLGDGGGVYIEGHQAAYQYEADGTTIDFDATMAHGLQVIGNVTYNQARLRVLLRRRRVGVDPLRRQRAIPQQRRQRPGRLRADRAFPCRGKLLLRTGRSVHLRQCGRQPRRQQHHHRGLAGAERHPADATASRRPGRVGSDVRRRDQPGNGLHLTATGDVLERQHEHAGADRRRRIRPAHPGILLRPRVPEGGRAVTRVPDRDTSAWCGRFEGLRGRSRRRTHHLLAGIGGDRSREHVHHCWLRDHR